MNIGLHLLSIPISIVLGVTLGSLIGINLVNMFKRFDIQDTKKLLIVLGLSILLTELENLLKSKIAIASLLGVMAIGFTMFQKSPDIGKTISKKFNNAWVFAEILLFVLVGAEVNISVAFKSGKVGLIIILIGLLGRSFGVLLSLIATNLNWKERLFCIISYIPKATVQAAIGAVPLSLGVESGETILALAVLSILITAPLGAIGIKYGSEKLL